MKRLILKVRNKSEITKLNEFCTIIYISKYLNIVSVDIRESDIILIEKSPNVISYRESREGEFLPSYTH